MDDGSALSPHDRPAYTDAAHLHSGDAVWSQCSFLDGGTFRIPGVQLTRCCFWTVLPLPCPTPLLQDPHPRRETDAVAREEKSEELSETPRPTVPGGCRGMSDPQLHTERCS